MLPAGPQLSAEAAHDRSVDDAELRENLSSLSTEEAAVLVLLRDRLAGQPPAPPPPAGDDEAPQSRAA